MPVGRAASFALTTLLALPVLAGGLSSCTSTANIVDVYTALDGEGARKRTLFFTDNQQIFCIVEAGVSRPGVTLEILVRQLQYFDRTIGRYVPTDRIYARQETSPSPTGGRAFFTLQVAALGADGEPQDDAPKDPGRFQCEAYLDGERGGQSIFNVDFADCPPAEITPGAVCSDYFRETQACKRYGQTANDPAMCTCTSATGWTCP